MVYKVSKNVGLQLAEISSTPRSVVQSAKIIAAELDIIDQVGCLHVHLQVLLHIWFNFLLAYRLHMQYTL